MRKESLTRSVYLELDVCIFGTQVFETRISKMIQNIRKKMRLKDKQNRENQRWRRWEKKMVGKLDFPRFTEEWDAQLALPIPRRIGVSLIWSERSYKSRQSKDDHLNSRVLLRNALKWPEKYCHPSCICNK